MKIVVTRTGGYAGVQSVANVDTSRLDAGRARAIEQLVGEAAAALARSVEPVGADLMRYDITVQEEGGQSRALSWTDDGTPSPGPVKQLIDEVVRLSNSA